MKYVPSSVCVRLLPLLLPASACFVLACGDSSLGVSGPDADPGVDDASSLDGSVRQSRDARSQAPPPESGACQRIDVIIAVDDSGSMSEERDAMRDTVFPAFATALLNVGDGLEDFRVGVVDACPDPANFHTRGGSGECNFVGGQAWMESGSDALVDEFACVGEIFSDDVECSGSNDDEQPASAAATALEALWITEANEGFVRSDALLVVVAITDEDETPVPSLNARQLYERLVAIKGDVRRMVFLGIGGSRRCEGVYGDAKEAELLRELTGLFEAEDRGIFWDLCGGRLEEGLDAALEVIDSACEQIPELI